MSRTKSRKGPTGASSASLAAEPPPLRRAQILELNRRLRDLEDRTRYLLTSVLTPKHALYYNVSEDTFGMGTPSYATRTKPLLRSILWSCTDFCRRRLCAWCLNGLACTGQNCWRTGSLPVRGSRSTTLRPWS